MSDKRRMASRSATGVRWCHFHVLVLLLAAASLRVRNMVEAWRPSESGEILRVILSEAGSPRSLGCTGPLGTQTRQVPRAGPTRGWPGGLRPQRRPHREGAAEVREGS